MRADYREPLDLDAISREWLNQCGPHDYGVDSAGCACAEGDYRPVMMQLVREVERLRPIAEKAVHIREVFARSGTQPAAAELQECLYQLANMVDSRAASLLPTSPTTGSNQEETGHG